MKIALAALVLCPILMASGCKEKPAPPPPPNPIIGAWACTATADKTAAKINTTFAADGTLTAKISVKATLEGKQIFGKLEATGGWGGSGNLFSQDLGAMTVLTSTSNGDQSTKGAATSLVRSLGLDAQEMVVEKLDETDFVYVTRATTVNCKRQAA